MSVFTTTQLADFDPGRNGYPVTILTGTDQSALQPFANGFAFIVGDSLSVSVGSPYSLSTTTPSSSTSPTTSTSTSNPTPTPTSTSTSPPATKTSSQSSPSSTRTNTGLSPATKAGLGVGLSLGIICIILIAALIFVLRRSKKRTDGSSTEPAYGIEGAPGYGTEAGREVQERKN
ncbi:MAG: hypothetical protein M1812_003969 [Candelaria pacifica]|nr:MAG: hypothetical protein M1812_003969 [Candelaria pacifica]